MPRAKPLFADSLLKFLSVVTGACATTGEPKTRLKQDGVARSLLSQGSIGIGACRRRTNDLKPKLYRRMPALKLYENILPSKTNEDEITRAFKSSATQLMTEAHLPSDDKGWYFLMQH